MEQRGVGKRIAVIPPWAALGLLGLAVVLASYIGLALLSTSRQQAPLSDASELISRFELLHTLDISHDNFVSAMDWSPDGRVLALAGEQIRLWDVETGHLAELSADVGHAHHLLWSPSGRLLAATSHTDTVTLLDPTTGAIERSLKVPLPQDVLIHVTKEDCHYNPRVTLGGWSDDERLFVSYIRLESPLVPHWCPLDTVYASVQVWDVTDGSSEPLHEIILEENARPARIDAGALSPDGLTLAALMYDERPYGGSSARLELWDVPSGKLKASIPTGRGYLMQWSPDGSALAYVVGYTVRVVDTASGSVKHDLPPYIPPTATPESLGNDRHHIALRYPNAVRVVRSNQSSSPTITPPMLPHPPLTPQLPVRTGQVPVPTDTPIPPSPTPTADVHDYSPVRDLVWSPDGRTLATSHSMSTKLWDAETGELKHQLWHTGLVPSDARPLVSWLLDGSVLTTVDWSSSIPSQAKIVMRFWDTATGADLHRITSHPTLRRFAWSPDSRTLALRFYEWPPSNDEGRQGWIELWGVRVTSLDNATPSAR